MEGNEKQWLQDHDRRSANAQSASPQSQYPPNDSRRRSRPVHSSTYPGPSSLPPQPLRSNPPTDNTPTDNPTELSAEPQTPNVTVDRSQPSWAKINRKPVQQRTFSVGSSVFRPDSLISINTSLGNNGSAFLSPPPSAQRLRVSSSTEALFNQASRSLSSLTQDLQRRRRESEETEVPPPYPAQSPSTTYPKDVKRSNPPSGREEPTDLFQIVRENRVDLLRRMLDRGVDVDEAEPATRHTAIMEAASLRRTQMAGMLIHAGCRLHLKDPYGNTALHFAAMQGDADTCKMLLDGDAQLNEYNNFGENPLQCAARGGHTDAAVCLLNSLTLQRTMSSTALLSGFLEATKSGNVSTAEAFVERGIDPKKIKESWRPVACAAQSGSIPMIDFLLFHKFNLKQRSPDGWTALHFASAFGHTAAVEKLLLWKLSWKAELKKTEETPLHLAVLGQHSATAMALLQHKDAKATVEDVDGQTPLHHAARSGDVLLVTALLEKGAKIDAQNKYGWTPMLLACAYGHLPLVAEFVTRGVNLEDKLESPDFRPGKKTNEAAKKGYWVEIRWPHSGARALHLALEFSHDEVANTLISAGAKIEESDAGGWTPLHYASFSARLRMVELLLNKGASPHATTADGNTPLSLGFRESGLAAPYEDKEQIYYVLQAAMYARKKSKLKQLASFMFASGNKSREVGERNKIWHTAGLADALYSHRQPLGGGGEEDYDDRSSIFTSTTGVATLIQDETEDDFSLITTSPRVTKSVTD